jgi:alkanesulfonate monooxygenase SsuD/methylene tetrahydromethanopterin reductase-like flavin-dependent oxidoreductase (luciferase family)
MGLYNPQHWVAHPAVWMQPLQMLSRLAPEAPGLKMITGVMILPMLNPVELAEQVITMDHITNGNFILGLGIGYREIELETVGATRAERVGRFEESLEIMKLLWSGEEVNYEGKFWQIHGAKVALLPAQKPHPPIWIAAQSRGACRRAARISDSCLLGPQPSWEEIARMAGYYWEALEEGGNTANGLLGAQRVIAIAKDRETALREAQAAAERKANMYGGWNMQEGTMVDLGLSSDRGLGDWAIVGSPEECAETINRCYKEQGLRYLGLGFLNLPREHQARLEYLQFISEELFPLLP